MNILQAGKGTTWSYENFEAMSPLAWRKNLTDSLGSPIDGGSSSSTESETYAVSKMWPSGQKDQLQGRNTQDRCWYVEKIQSFVIVKEEMILLSVFLC